jgi:5-methyltetrahydrofolate--homocysteine methyltransferase
MKDIYKTAIERWQGNVQLDMTDLGGNLDIVSTFRPAEKLLLDLYDHPDEVKRLLWEAHHAWHVAFNDLSELLKPTNPGHTAWASIFSDEPYYMLQCDFCYMIGPDMFDEFVKPELDATCKLVSRPFYHLDGPGQIPHLDSLLQIPELKGIQWVPGSGSKSESEWPEIHRKIRDADKLAQIFDWRALDSVCEQRGSGKGIIVLGGAHITEEEEVMALLKRHGAA